MPFRVPLDLATLPRRESGASALQHQLMAEGAASLGRLGRAVEAALAELSALEPASDADRREALLYACADAVWRYFVQREVCGLVNHDRVVETYAIPPEVLARVGASPVPSDSARDAEPAPPDSVG